MDSQISEQKSGLGEKLHQLFLTKRTVDGSEFELPALSNSENRRQGETYQQWGIRICGIVSGSLTALPPYLQKVYNLIYNEQAKNVELQQAARANTQAQIEQKNAEIKSVNEQIGIANSDIDRMNQKIEELKAEKQEIKTLKEQVNKEQRLKLIVGLCILIPLTVYLFFFYSSTFYSAFFRNPDSMTTVMNSMFDPNALANALASGITELGFVLCAPIIFLGLGFSLHFFSVQKERTKYLKMAAILIVTFLFDCILAYKIGEQLHTFGIIIGQYPIGEQYTVSMAFHDVNTWAVVFCGFVVYVIWGIVFDMSMTAYNNMDLNKTRLENIKKEMEGLEKKITTRKNDIQAMKRQVNAIGNEIKNLMAKLGHETYIDYTAIRTEMTNFFAGWITQMQLLSQDQDMQDQATTIFKSQTAMLIPQKQS